MARYLSVAVTFLWLAAHTERTALPQLASAGSTRDLEVAPLDSIHPWTVVEPADCDVVIASGTEIVVARLETFTLHNQ